MADFVLGLADRLVPRDVAAWANTLRLTGFSGEAVLFTLTEDIALRELCNVYKIALVKISEVFAYPKTLNKERWKFYSDFIKLKKIGSADRVLVTDVRDVFFQGNPFVWLDSHLEGEGLVVSLEDVVYENEPWNRDHALTVCGKDFYELVLKHRIVANAGVIAGDAATFGRTCRMVHEFVYLRPSDSSDQIVYNFILAAITGRLVVLETTHEHGFACHGAVAYRGRTVIDGLVRVPSGEPYAIVHQYDRQPAWQSVLDNLLSGS